MAHDSERPDDARLMELFDKKRADLRCPVCTNTEFLLIDRWSDDEASIFDIYKFQTGKLPTKTGSLKTVAVACGNCGHIQQFVLDVLMKEPEPST